MIHVFSIVRNDEYILPYLLRHYSTFADKIFIFDDHSTDCTVEIAKSFPKVKCLPFEYNRGMNEDDFNECFENAYKKYSRGVADWVMLVDSDEFIYKKDIVNELKKQRERGVRAIRPIGYIMVSEKKPHGSGQIYEENKFGIRYPYYDKPVIFDPELDVSLGHGRHTIELPKNIELKRAQIMFLHYRYLSEEYFIQRSTHLFERCEYMDEKTKKYRMNRGLNFFKDSLKSPKLINLID